MVPAAALAEVSEVARFEVKIVADNDGNFDDNSEAREDDEYDVEKVPFVGKAIFECTGVVENVISVATFAGTVLLVEMTLLLLSL